MSPISQVFTNHIDIVFFLYGLSFFCMGLAVLLEAGRTSNDFAVALRPLGLFGLIHGSHEWFEMFLILNPDLIDNSCTNWISIVRVILLAASFIFLVDFGAGLVSDVANKQTKRVILSAVTLVWLIGLVIGFITNPSIGNCLINADVYTRYSMAIPGSVLTAWGLIVQRKKFFRLGMKGFGNDVTVAALAFLLYGAVGQLFSSPSAIFPSHFVNSSAFLDWFGFPVQVFRALMATIVAVFIIRSLRASEIESQRQIAELREMQMAERLAYEEARAELLHRTVKAQESERQRIAQELHDGTGQTLTGLGMGLRALAENIDTEPQRAIQQTQQLEKLATNGIEELQRMVSGLHPPQLEDLGLVAALRWYSDEISRHSNLKIVVSGKGDERSLPQEVRTVFFRIAQEAVTNILRHASATQVLLDFECNGNSCFLRVEDDGCGFQVEQTLKDTTKPHWGLLGMQERAALIQGSFVIESSPGFGTLVMVEWWRSDSDV